MTAGAGGRGGTGGASGSAGAAGTGGIAGTGGRGGAPGSVAWRGGNRRCGRQRRRAAAAAAAAPDAVAPAGAERAAVGARPAAADPRAVAAARRAAARAAPPAARGRAHPRGDAAHGLELVEQVRSARPQRNPDQGDGGRLRLERHEGRRLPVRQPRRLLDGRTRFQRQAAGGTPASSRPALPRSPTTSTARGSRSASTRRRTPRPASAFTAATPRRRRQPRSRNHRRADVRVVGHRLPQVRQVPAQLERHSP